MNMFLKRLITVFLPLFLVNFFSPLWAQVFVPEGGNIKVGKLRIHPSLSIQETYSDNIYQNYGGLPSDSGFITTISSGMKLILPIASHQFFADAKADFNLYSVDSETNYSQQKTGGGAKLNFAGGVDLFFSYYYTGSEIPRRSRSKSGISQESDYFHSRPFYQNEWKGLAGFTFTDRWRIEAFYHYYNYQYKNSLDIFGNYDRPLVGTKLFYRFTPSISALGEYNYIKTTYPNASAYDNKTHLAFLGFSFDPAAKLIGELKVGYGSKKYDQSIVGRKENMDNLTVNINLTQRFNPYSSLKLLLNRAILEDIDTNAPYTENKTRLEFRHVWSRNEKIAGKLSGGYSTLSFEGSTLDIDGRLKKRDDQRWEIDVGIDYDLIRWLTMSLGYQYTSNKSNFINYDFGENRVFISLLGSF
jgi:hypothetical protein